MAGDRDRFTRTPAPGRTLRTQREIEVGVTPVPINQSDDDGDEADFGLLASVVPANVRRTATHAAERAAALGTQLLGSNASILVRTTQAFFGFCVWYTVFHGFFGFSSCFGAAGHQPTVDASPPVYHAPSPLGRSVESAKPHEDDGDASGGEVR